MFLRLSKVKIEYEQNVIYMNIRIIEYTRNTYIRYGFIKWKLFHKAENKDAYKPINPLNLFKKKNQFLLQHFFLLLEIKFPWLIFILVFFSFFLSLNRPS